jgi:hypothetical protein
VLLKNQETKQATVMTSKRKHNTVLGKLNSSNRIMYGDTQASLLHKFGIPKVHSWMKEENKFCSFVDSLVDLYRSAKEDVQTLLKQ